MAPWQMITKLTICQNHEEVAKEKGKNMMTHVMLRQCKGRAERLSIGWHEAMCLALLQSVYAIVKAGPNRIQWSECVYGGYLARNAL